MSVSNFFVLMMQMLHFHKGSRMNYVGKDRSEVLHLLRYITRKSINGLEVFTRSNCSRPFCADQCDRCHPLLV